MSMPAALPDNLPEYLARPDLAELSVLLRHAQHGAFAFALYNTVAVRDQVVAALRILVAPLPVYEFTLTSQQRNPLSYLEKLPAETRRQRAVVFIYDLDRANTPDQPDTTWGYLDAQREALIEYPHGLVFWLTEQGATDAAQYAPNVWSRKSGVFDFKIESLPVLSQARADWSGRAVEIEKAEDLERLTRLYLGLLEEYQAEANTPQALIADLHGKVAFLLFRSYRHHEAVNHLNLQLEFARQSGNTAIEAQALLNMGDVQNFRDERDAALESYSQALGLFRAVGARLGEANVFLALGDIKRATGDIAGAEMDFENALKTYQTIGDRYSQGLAYYRIGDCAADRLEHEAALAFYQKAASAWTEIGLSDLVEQILATRIAEAMKRP